MPDAGLVLDDNRRRRWSVVKGRPALGQFLSPDTLVPDAGLVLDYNRYMYVRGNPLKYTDPSGHCGVVADGEIPDDEAECWQNAVHIWMHWNGNPDYWQRLFGMNRDDFWLKIASDPHQRAAQLESHINTYWSKFYGTTGLHHNTYNPRPTTGFVDGPQHPIHSITNPCSFWDCPAIAMTVASLALSIGQSASIVCAASGVGAAACGPSAATFTSLDVAVNGAAWVYEANKFVNDQATMFDLTFTSVELAQSAVDLAKFAKPTAGAVASTTPFVGVGYDSVMLAYEIFFAPWVETPGATRVAR